MRNDHHILIQRIHSVDPNDFVRLYKEAGWWKETFTDDPSFINNLVKGSTCFVGAFKGERMVGMGRSISDGASDAYIQDVTVKKNFRGQGIGSKIIQKLVERLHSDGLKWIGLIAEKNSHPFYEQLGFKKMSDSVPMLKIK